MPVRSGVADWEGGLRAGRGTVRLESGALEGPYSFTSRFEEGTGTNPEELIAAAHAGCFSMALAHAMEQANFAPTRIHTEAKVHLVKAGEGFEIPRIELIMEAVVPEMDDATFQRYAREAKENCPVSKLLTAEITLDAKLLATQPSGP